MVSRIWDLYSHLICVSLRSGKDYWTTIGSAPTGCTSLTQCKTQMSNNHNDTKNHELFVNAQHRNVSNCITQGDYHVQAVKNQT